MSMKEIIDRVEKLIVVYGRYATLNNVLADLKGGKTKYKCKPHIYNYTRKILSTGLPKCIHCGKLAFSHKGDQNVYK